MHALDLVRLARQTIDVLLGSRPSPLVRASLKEAAKSLDHALEVASLSETKASVLEAVQFLKECMNAIGASQRPTDFGLLDSVSGLLAVLENVNRAGPDGTVDSPPILPATEPLSRSDVPAAWGDQAGTGVADRDAPVDSKDHRGVSAPDDGPEHE